MTHCNSYTVVFSVLHPLLNMCPKLQDHVKQSRSATLFICRFLHSHELHIIPVLSTGNGYYANRLIGAWHPGATGFLGLTCSSGGMEKNNTASKL